MTKSEKTISVSCKNNNIQFFTYNPEFYYIVTLLLLSNQQLA
jgi:hypothetical protein